MTLVVPKSHGGSGGPGQSDTEKYGAACMFYWPSKYTPDATRRSI